MKKILVTTLAMVAFATTSYAAVTYDADGVGFVGKGDVQSIYDWNNSMLQDNAASVQFQMLDTSSASWRCSGVNPAGNPVTNTLTSESASVNADVSFDARKNKNGQVTGFILNGTTNGSTTVSSVGVCPTDDPTKWITPRALVLDSIEYEGNGDPLLQVSIDGGDWRDLPATD